MNKDDANSKQLASLGSTLDMNNYFYKFNVKKASLKVQEDFIKFYQENSLILHMIEYCKVINMESVSTNVISVDTAIDFFSFLSVSVRENDVFTNGLNRSKEIIEDSFEDDPLLPLDQLSPDMIIDFDYLTQIYEKVKRDEAFKKKHEEEICKSSHESMIAEIRAKLTARGDKAFTTLIRQFQSTDFHNFKHINQD